MQVQVEEVYPDPGQTVWRARGTRVSDGMTVVFAGDWRPMREVWIAVTDGDQPVAEVPEWAVLSGAQ